MAGRTTFRMHFDFYPASGEQKKKSPNAALTCELLLYSYIKLHAT
jgi:hypothetical protein